jgi:hypothetical protein
MVRISAAERRRVVVYQQLSLVLRDIEAGARRIAKQRAMIAADAERTTTRARASLATQEALVELLPKAPTGPVADAEIRRRVLEEINNQ